ncbi:MAG: bacillithiol biosynthesis deacetylase BshB1 [Planctomycetes bacterium]|nr:bacillithiol biosynthesis deacetylase BshB1 [Planctomycetota bacterium]
MADVLAFGAHPDDLEIGCGGTLALLAQQGRSVVMVDFTRGELGTRGTVAERRAEAAAAAKVLGAAARLNLELPDGFLPFADPQSGHSARELAVTRVVDLIREQRPRLLLANFPRDAHPDHVIVGDVVKQARYLAGLRKFQPGRERHRPALLLHYFEHEQHPPTCVVDISAVIEQKLAAIRCHRSQLHDPTRAEPQTALSRPDFVERRAARDRFFGAQAGVDWAEPFFTDGPPKIADPMSLLP